MRTLLTFAFASLCRLAFSYTDPIVSNLIFSYGKTTFQKTKTACHLSFLRDCVRLRVIPKGFRLQHTPSDHTNTFLLQKTDKLLSETSSKLIKIHIQRADRELSILSARITALKNQLSTILPHNISTTVKHTTHDLNQQVFTFVNSTKQKKLSQLLQTSSAVVSSLNHNSSSSPLYHSHVGSSAIIPPHVTPFL